MIRSPRIALARTNSAPGLIPPFHPNQALATRAAGEVAPAIDEGVEEIPRTPPGVVPRRPADVMGDFVAGQFVVWTAPVRGIAHGVTTTAQSALRAPVEGARRGAALASTSTTNPAVRLVENAAGATLGAVVATALAPVTATAEGASAGFEIAFEGIVRGVARMSGQAPVVDAQPPLVDEAPAEPEVPHTQRSVEELDRLIDTQNQALRGLQIADGLRDFVVGQLTLSNLPGNVVLSGVTAAASTLWNAPADGARRGVAAVARPSSTGMLQAFEHGVGALTGAAIGTLTAPVRALAAGTTAAVDRLTDDVTTVVTRLPRGFLTFAKLGVGLDDIDHARARMTVERDAMLLERAAAASRPALEAPPTQGLLEAA
jgi:hypothetical protein